MQKIHFFPTSLPDETLQSRVTRYHYLSGNKFHGETFRDLFGCSPFSLARIAERMNVLAERLPGDRGSNIADLFDNNTIYPAYRPFLSIFAARGVCGEIERAIFRDREICRARICISCSQEDMDKHGFYYWHRAHQLHGVMVCWRHGEFLIHCCPSCSHPFYRTLKLLVNPMSECICGWSPRNLIVREQVPKEEKDYAEFAKSMLQADMPSVGREVLSACYRRQAIKMGYVSGKNFKSTALGDSIKGRYSEDSLLRIDSKHASVRNQPWVRLASNYIEMPVSRHLLISRHLFGSAQELKDRLCEEIQIFSEYKSLMSASKRAPEERKKAYREKINTLIQARPGLDIKYLWEHAYRATLWLTENDKLWLIEKLSAIGEQDKYQRGSDSCDMHYAELIRLGVEDLYKVSEKAKRVNITNTLQLLPRKINTGTYKNRARFPLVRQQLEIHAESLWHFRLRRTIWVLVEAARLKLPLRKSNFIALSTLEPRFIRQISDFFKWNLEEMADHPLDAESLLRSTGVSRQWEGPFGNEASE